MYLREKPILKPKPPCLGCDICHDFDDPKFYVLGYDDKYRCVKCFKEWAQNWPKRRKNETR